MGNILVKRVTHNTKVTQGSRAITVRSQSRDINVHSVGRRGPQGVAGAAGATGPEGPQGPAGADGIDANFVENFTNLASVTVTHNLGKWPAVTVVDSTGDEVEGEIEHVSINQLIATFSSSFTGRITCN